MFHTFAVLANYRKIGVKLIYLNDYPEFNFGNGILNQDSIVQLMNLYILDTRFMEKNVMMF